MRETVKDKASLLRILLHEQSVSKRNSTETVIVTVTEEGIHGECSSQNQSWIDNVEWITQIRAEKADVSTVDKEDRKGSLVSQHYLRERYI